MTDMAAQMPYMLTLAQGGGGELMSFLPMIIAMGAIMYFLIIRPQQKRDKEKKDMMEALKKGDKVVTIGGLRGTIARIAEEYVVLTVDENVKVEFVKSAIAHVRSEGKKKEDE